LNHFDFHDFSSRFLFISYNKFCLINFEILFNEKFRKENKNKNFHNKIYNNIQIAIKMEIDKKNELKQQSSKFLRDLILTSNSYDTSILYIILKSL